MKNKFFKTKKALLDSQKNAFWMALILTIFVFAGGILLGFMLENSRTSQISKLYQEAEINLLDVQIQSNLLSFSDLNCEYAIQENINFANNVYEEAKLLVQYEEASRLSDAIKLQHKKYDLLRTLFWVNAIKLKEKCNASYHNLVYIYDYNEPRLDIKAKQYVFSKILGDVREKQGDNVMLIPIAGDNDISSLRMLMNLYNISESELPVILIDEKIKITQVEKPEDIENLMVF